VTTTETNTSPSPEATAATTQVDALEVSEVGIQSDPSPVPAVVGALASSISSVELRDRAIEKIFKALHVCSRYKEVTGKDLPENVDFFGKSLLGLTSIRGFGFTLAETLRSVQVFLDVSSIDLDTCPTPSNPSYRMKFYVWIVYSTLQCSCLIP
jgi:hypothetical protein